MCLYICFLSDLAKRVVVFFLFFFSFFPFLRYKTECGSPAGYSAACCKACFASRPCCVRLGKATCFFTFFFFSHVVCWLVFFCATHPWFLFVDDCVTQQDGLYKRRFLHDEQCAALRRLQRATIVRKIAAAERKRNGLPPSTGQEVCVFCVCACIYYIYINIYKYINDMSS